MSHLLFQPRVYFLWCSVSRHSDSWTVVTLLKLTFRYICSVQNEIIRVLDILPPRNIFHHSILCEINQSMPMPSNCMAKRRVVRLALAGVLADLCRQLYANIKRFYFKWCQTIRAHFFCPDSFFFEHEKEIKLRNVYRISFSVFSYFVCGGLPLACSTVHNRKVKCVRSEETERDPPQCVYLQIGAPFVRRIPFVFDTARLVRQRCIAYLPPEHIYRKNTLHDIECIHIQRWEHSHHFSSKC